jgi:general secretion pathway protein A
MLETFGVTREPFVHEVSPSEAFEWSDLREGLKRLAYGVKCRGVVCVSGKTGCGKTTLLRTFVAGLNPSLYKVLAVKHTTGTPMDLLVHLAHRFGLEPSHFRSRLVLSVQGACVKLAAAKVQTVLVVDEAHYLTWQALNELRLLLSSDLDEHRLLTVVLCGHEDLEARLRIPFMASFQQRITTWVRLGSLRREETAPYLLHRLKLAGIPANLDTEPAVFALHQLSSGFFRLLDRLAHHALIACALDQATEVNEDHVRLAAEEVSA